MTLGHQKEIIDAINSAINDYVEDIKDLEADDIESGAEPGYFRNYDNIVENFIGRLAEEFGDMIAEIICQEVYERVK